MSNNRVLTGITATGAPHLGNYVGAIRPAVAASKDSSISSFFFLADYHALIKCHDPVRVALSTREIAATWLALGLDVDNATFYRQSDIPEIPQLSWILTCLTSKGLMNRAHAYKAVVDANQEAGKSDLDDGVLMGLFSYPILMAADILMFNATQIPVGKDQVQHIEMARDIAGRFNHTFADLFALPEAIVDEEAPTIAGLDGRKMSKSYNNTIPLFCSSDELRKLINQIQTDLREPGEPKDPDSSTIFELYSRFGSDAEIAAFRTKFEEGIAWGDAKKELLEYLDNYLAQPRQRYNELMSDLGEVDRQLQLGAAKAREVSAPFLEKVRQAVGLCAVNGPLPTVENKSKTKKEKTGEEAARAEEGRRRAILMQLKSVLAQVENADDSAAEAKAVIDAKEQEIAGLKKKAKQKAENELVILKEEFAEYL